jgi:hypothetical protein
METTGSRVTVSMILKKEEEETYSDVIGSS